MAKADPRSLALEALCRAVADPRPKVLHGSAKVPGIFKGGGKAEKDAARLCAEQHWLEPTGESAGKGKTKKDLYRLTPAGAREALENTEPAVLVRHLAPALRDGQETLSALRQRLDGLDGALATLASAVDRLSAKVELPDLEPLLRRLIAERPPAAEPKPAGLDWLDEVVRMVQEQKQRNAFQRLTLPQVYEQLKATRPGLTLGQFHDGLRALQQQRRIQLGPYTQALATLDDARNALYLDREVKYYVDVS